MLRILQMKSFSNLIPENAFLGLQIPSLIILQIIPVSMLEPNENKEVVNFIIHVFHLLEIIINEFLVISSFRK